MANDIVQLYLDFVDATDMKPILDVFSTLCDKLDIHPLDDGWFYGSLKAKLTHWKATSLWARLDKKIEISMKEYENHKACKNQRVLIIGAGPCGLRAAIECKLLGARVVVMEKRSSFSRNNVLHLWNFVIADLRLLGAKVFEPKFCTGNYEHIAIRQLQSILLKIALVLGVEVHHDVSFVDLIEPESPNEGWKAQCVPDNHPINHYNFDVLIGADGKKNTLKGFPRAIFRASLAIAITANFINRNTEAEQLVSEINGVSRIFRQRFFADMYEETGIELENIVYYKDCTHYFVMTATKKSLIEMGVFKSGEDKTPEQLLQPSNIDHEALADYAREAADFSTDRKLPVLEYCTTKYGVPDVSIFDFTATRSADTAVQVKERHGRKLLMCIVGDSLLEPFWPTGSGCGKGFLSVMDACWAVKHWGSGKWTPLDVLAERESIRKLLGHIQPDQLHKNFNNYSINPRTRYKHINLRAVKPIEMLGYYDTTEEIDTEALEPVAHEPKNTHTYDAIQNSDRLLRWCNKRLAVLPPDLRPTSAVTDLTSCWADGQLFLLLLHVHKPEIIPRETLNSLTAPVDRLKHFLQLANKHLGVLSLLTAEELVMAECSDSLYMAGMMTQIYTGLRHQPTLGAAPEFLTSPSAKARPGDGVASPVGKKRSHRKSTSGTLSKAMRRRKSSLTNQKSPKSPKSPNPLKSNQNPISGPLSPRGASKRVTDSLVRDRSLMKSKMKQMKEVFTFKHKNKKIEEEQRERPKVGLRNSWLVDKDDFSVHDAKMKEFDRRIQAGNLGNVNPGIRGANQVSNVANLFEKAPEPPSEPRRPSLENQPPTIQLMLNREPKSHEVCCFCKDRVYMVESRSAEGKNFHANCFRCYVCDALLHMSNYQYSRSVTGVGRFYCSLHVGQEKKEHSPRRPSRLSAKRPPSKDASPNLSAEAANRSVSSPDVPPGIANQKMDEEGPITVNMRKRKQLNTVVEQNEPKARVSILKRPLSTVAPPKPQRSTNQMDSNGAMTNQNGDNTLPPSSNLQASPQPTPEGAEHAPASIQAAFHRRSNFFSETPQPVRINPRFSLIKDAGVDIDKPETPPDSYIPPLPTDEFTSNDNPLTSTPDTSLTGNNMSDVEICVSGTRLSPGRNTSGYMADTLARAHNKSNSNPKNLTSSAGSKQAANQIEELRNSEPVGPIRLDIPHWNYEESSDQSDGGQMDKSDDDPEHHSGVHLDQSDSDDESEGLSEVSTPSEDEMALIGTLGPDGKLQSASICYQAKSEDAHLYDNVITSRQSAHTPRDNLTSAPNHGSSFSNPAYSDEVVYHQPVRVQNIGEGEESSDNAYETIDTRKFKHVTPRSARRARKGSHPASPPKPGAGGTPKKLLAVDPALANFNEWDSSSDDEQSAGLSASFSRSCRLSRSNEPIAAIASDSYHFKYDSDEEWDSCDDNSPSMSPPTSDDSDLEIPAGADSTLVKAQRAALRQQRQEELKRVHMAQEIQRQLDEVVEKTRTLEEEGKELEKTIRKPQGSPATPSNSLTADSSRSLMNRWFNIVHQKSLLLRFETELHMKSQELQLEDQHMRLSNDLRALMSLPAEERNLDHEQRENELIQEIIQVVNRRDNLVKRMEEDRIKERKEDQDLQLIMSSKGFNLNAPSLSSRTQPPRRRVTVKSGYNKPRALLAS